MVSAKAKGDGAAETAPPRFTSSDNLNVDDVPYLQPAPRQPWEPCGWACRFQAAHWRSEGLADYNPGSATPSDVWVNDTAYHYPPAQGHGEKGNCTLFLDRIYRSCVSGKGRPSRKGTAALLPARSRRFFPSSLCKNLHNELFVARLGGNVPAWLVFLFQATGERCFCPFTL